jgi:hypothetical protein
MSAGRALLSHRADCERPRRDASDVCQYRRAFRELRADLPVAQAARLAARRGGGCWRYHLAARSVVWVDACRVVGRVGVGGGGGARAQETTYSWGSPGPHPWTVRDTESALDFEVSGAQGGSSSGPNSAPGGQGAYVEAPMFLSSGQALMIFVGGGAVQGAPAATTAAAGSRRRGRLPCCRAAAVAHQTCARGPTGSPIASGGGGGGIAGTGAAGGTGGASGNAGTGLGAAGGGAPGTSGAAGAGGKSGGGAGSGADGSLGQGGAGASLQPGGAVGGGGGGGYYGGGGGGGGGRGGRRRWRRWFELCRSEPDLLG